MNFSLNIKTTIQALISQEDTNGNKKITIEDNGPKAFKIFSDSGEQYVVKGTYHLSNLLQELVIAKNQGLSIAKIPLHNIEELPANRVSRMIKDFFWSGLTRTLDAKGIKKLILDSKNESLISNKLRVYCSFKDKMAYNYYKDLEKNFPIVTIKLPEQITAEYVKSINIKPGILALKLEEKNNKITGLPFVVPGGRFNEMYGWDSYFQSIGLIIDGKIELAKATADHFKYEIEHYGKILNANRSYYLTRTQPPFYSSLITEVFNVTQDKDWLSNHLKTAIKEYEFVWMVQGKRLTKNGLNRYLAEGVGMPPECEFGHFDTIVKPLADKLQILIPEYLQQYQNGIIKNKALDAYFLNDRSVRESGHDTSYRIEGNCSELNLVELNALLYKYESDFANLIENEFNNSFKIEEKIYSSEYWKSKAESRKINADHFLWSDAKSMYLDYNHISKMEHEFVSATNLIPLWSKMASQNQAEQLVKTILPLLKEKGGIAGSTELSRGKITKDRPSRQWDYPNGWAPHQMMIWKGLINYGFLNEAQELIYRWLYMITKNAVDYNGTIPEKYDVVEATHKVFSEYGNVGTDFNYITQEGFGWMNASFQYGLSLLNKNYIENLNHLIEPEILFN